jgi:hypothetical protein
LFLGTHLLKIKDALFAAAAEAALYLLEIHLFIYRETNVNNPLQTITK